MLLPEGGTRAPLRRAVARARTQGERKKERIEPAARPVCRPPRSSPRRDGVCKQVALGSGAECAPNMSPARPRHHSPSAASKQKTHQQHPKQTPRFQALGLELGRWRSLATPQNSLKGRADPAERLLKAYGWCRVFGDRSLKRGAFGRFRPALRRHGTA